MYHFSPHGTSASWVLMVVRCGLAGCVAGLAVTAVAASPASSPKHVEQIISVIKSIK
jgi:hypothetical protein